MQLCSWHTYILCHHAYGIEEDRTLNMLTREEILKHLSVDCPRIECFERIDSTNSFLKREAVDGAPHGSVAAANCQSAGRGRLGRTFQSPADRGIYLSVLLRPNLPGEVLMSATGMAAVAVSRAIKRTAGVQVGIKWTNDLILNGKKLAGILAETVVIGQEIALVIGVGVNVHHRREDFAGEVADIATSLAMEGITVNRAALAAAMIEELYAMGDALGGDIGAYIEEYRCSCVTLGREVRLVWSEEQKRAQALDIDEKFGLVVRFDDGSVTTVRTGEVSVRGLYGYAE